MSKFSWEQLGSEHIYHCKRNGDSKFPCQEHDKFCYVVVCSDKEIKQSVSKKCNNSLHLIMRITVMDPKFPPDNGLSPFLPHIQSEITAELQNFCTLLGATSMQHDFSNRK